MGHSWPHRSQQWEFSERLEPPCILELLGGPEENREKESLLITCRYTSCLVIRPFIQLPGLGVGGENKGFQFQGQTAEEQTNCCCKGARENQ